MVIRYFLALTLLVISFPVISKVDTPKGVDTIRKVRRSYQTRIDLSIEVPQYPQYYLWKVRGKVGDVMLYKESVPLYRYDENIRGLREISRIKVGTAIEIDAVFAYNGRMYYRIPVEPTEKNNAKFGWLDGLFIERDSKRGYKPKKKSR